MKKINYIGYKQEQRRSKEDAVALVFCTIII